VYKSKYEMEKKKRYLQKLYSKHYNEYKSKVTQLSSKTKVTEWEDLFQL